jgi:uncharacterized protein (DUF58 family)
MDLKTVERTVAKIKNSLFKNSNSFSIGMLKSKFKGTGLQFKEHQVYSHGDDVRFIDWKILAKTNNPYIKTFEEERNVEIVVVIDATETMMTGYNNVSKLQASVELCCLLYLIAKESGDYVHAVIVSDKVTAIKRASGEAGVINLVSSLEKERLMNSDGKINIAREYKGFVTEKEMMINVLKHLERQREVVLFSDFNNFIDHDFLKRIAIRTNVHCFQLLSPIDYATKIPYSIITKRFISPGKFTSRQELLYVKTETKVEKSIGSKIKKLHLEGRYLEEFVREMI